MSDPVRNPDWYRVKYSLAAECLNWALAEGGVGGQQLVDANRETRELLAVVDRRLHRRRGWGRKARREADPRLDAFLGGHVKPGALILLAGIELVVRGAGEERTVEVQDLSLDEVERQIEKGARVDPFAIVRRVEAHWEPLPPAISYNLACFFMQAGWAPEALRHLTDCVEGTAPSFRPLLQAQLEGDPLLGPLLEMSDETLFDEPVKRLVDRQKDRHRREDWL